MNTDKYKLLKLTWLIKKAHQEALSDTISKFNLSPNEGIILLFLFKHDLNTAKEIAEYRSISKSLVSKSINNLMDQGLIDLRVDLLDKRINRLDLTEKADPIIKELNQDEINFYTSLEEGLSEDDRKLLDGILNTLYENVTKVLDI